MIKLWLSDKHYKTSSPFINSAPEPENCPSIVECQFVDVHGGIQLFRDKDAIFTQEILDRHSHYPTDGVVACEVMEMRNFKGRDIVTTNTKLPWHIESTIGETMFEVWAEQIIEFEHLIKS